MAGCPRGAGLGLTPTSLTPGKQKRLPVADFGWWFQGRLLQEDYINGDSVVEQVELTEK